MVIYEMATKVKDRTHTEVILSVKCYNREEIDAVIAWLKLAASVMKGWEKIGEKAAYAQKAPPSKDENNKSREVLSPAQEPVRKNG